MQNDPARIELNIDFYYFSGPTLEPNLVSRDSYISAVLHIAYTTFGIPTYVFIII